MSVIMHMYDVRQPFTDNFIDERQSILTVGEHHREIDISDNRHVYVCNFVSYVVFLFHA